MLAERLPITQQVDEIPYLVIQLGLVAHRRPNFQAHQFTQAMFKAVQGHGQGVFGQANCFGDE